MDGNNNDEKCPDCGGKLTPDGKYADKCESCGRYYYKSGDSNEEPE